MLRMQYIQAATAALIEHDTYHELSMANSRFVLVRVHLPGHVECGESTCNQTRFATSCTLDLSKHLLRHPFRHLHGHRTSLPCLRAGGLQGFDR